MKFESTLRMIEEGLLKPMTDADKSQIADEIAKEKKARQEQLYREALPSYEKVTAQFNDTFKDAKAIFLYQNTNDYDYAIPDNANIIYAIWKAFRIETANVKPVAADNIWRLLYFVTSSLADFKFDRISPIYGESIPKRLIKRNDLQVYGAKSFICDRFMVFSMYNKSSWKPDEYYVIDANTHEILWHFQKDEKRFISSDIKEFQNAIFNHLKEKAFTRLSKEEYVSKFLTVKDFFPPFEREA
jgi:hypothetical protein